MYAGARGAPGVPAWCRRVLGASDNTAYRWSHIPFVNPSQLVVHGRGLVAATRKRLVGLGLGLG